jgi:hypothetical protein
MGLPEMHVQSSATLLIGDGAGLRAPDAIHLATAKRESVTAFSTYEEGTKLTRWADVLGFPVGPPQATALTLALDAATEDDSAQ